MASSLLSPDFWTVGTGTDLSERKRIICNAVPEPLPHQVPIMRSSARFKVGRCGRRFGKTRVAEAAAFRGHGPINPLTGEPIFRGIAQGMDVVWVAQDYPNLTRVVWKEDFKPRFEPLPFAKLNQNEHTIAIDGLGTLILCPETAISGIRGIGKRLGGVILDEAAFYDLESALQDVIMPALIDNGGWLMIFSTTNAGPDGNSAKRVPSYFNTICEQIRAGERSKDWQEFTGTAFDNTALPKAAVDALVAEYPADSPKLKQEVYVELLRGGVGVALAQVSAEKHIIPRFRIPTHWTQFGAIDWGFNHPWVFGHFAIDTDGNVILVDTVWGRNELPGQIGAKIKTAVSMDDLDAIDAGHDIWQDRRARGENVPTLYEQFRDMGIFMRQANISRVSGLNNLRHYLQWQKTETEPERTPRFRMMDTPGNRWVLRVLESMQVDPKNLEDALKVDATGGIGSDGFPVGGDDPYDMVRYALASRPFTPEPINARHAPADLQDIAWANARGESLEDGGYTGGVTMDYDPVDYG